MILSIYYFTPRLLSYYLHSLFAVASPSAKARLRSCTENSNQHDDGPFGANKT